MQESPGSQYIIGKAALQANNFYTFSLTYYSIGSPGTDVTFSALLLTKNPSNQTLLAPIPASMLFAGEHLRGSPYDVTVVPSAACASLSVASLVSIVTVGVSSTFSLEIRDSFHNIRPCGLSQQPQWVQFFGMEPIPGIYAATMPSCTFSFTPSNATIGYTNVQIGNTFVFPDSSALIVLSGRLDLNRSALKFLSHATAGVPMSFSITFFDAVNNSKDMQTLSSNVQLTLHNSNPYSGMKPFRADVQPALAPLTKPPTFYFVVTVSAQFFVSVSFMNASFARLPLVIAPGAACSANCFMIGDAVSLATNGGLSRFYVQLRDSFGNAAFMDDSFSISAFASTLPRFSRASIMSMPSVSAIPISFSFQHTRIDKSMASIPLPQISAMFSYVGGLTAT